MKTSGTPAGSRRRSSLATCSTSFPLSPAASSRLGGGAFVEPRLTVLTIGVDDLERSLRFYRDGLGFATDGIIGTEFDHGAVVFIDLQPGLRLALWPRESIARDSGLAAAPSSSTDLTLGHNVDSDEEVD